VETRGRKPISITRKKIAISIAVTPGLLKEIDRRCGNYSRSATIESMLWASIEGAR
jgi:hypothetical protein